MIVSITVKGDDFVWPKSCSCCNREAETTRSFEREFKDSTGYAPVEYTYTNSSTQQIPICHKCLTHAEASVGLDYRGFLYGMMTILLLAVYFYIAIAHRSAIADFFGFAPRNIWIPNIAVLVLALIFMIYIAVRLGFKSREGLSSSCAHPDGGVLYTGFVCPTPASPEIDTTFHTFTFRNDRYREKFVIANQGRCARKPEPDDWDNFK